MIGERGVQGAAPALLVREICMLKVVEDITNKPEWWSDVRKTKVTTIWKNEMLRLKWRNYLKYADFTSSMADSVS